MDIGPGDSESDEGYDIRIARDGTWHHEGAPIKRLELVRLFASVLRRDDAGDHWLVTPAERGRILVEDAPFIAVEMRRDGEGRDASISFRTNLDEWVTADPDHPIRMGVPCGAVAGGAEDQASVPVPYVTIRDRLEARISRAVYYEMIERATTMERDASQDDATDADGEGVIGLWSGGRFFILGDTSETEGAEPDGGERSGNGPVDR